jgi:hypothetical protein
MKHREKGMDKERKRGGVDKERERVRQSERERERKRERESDRVRESGEQEKRTTRYLCAVPEVNITFFLIQFFVLIGDIISINTFSPLGQIS